MSGARMTRVVVVDDEAPARRLIVEYLSLRRDIEIVAECADGFAAVRAITELRPDLVLLDIQMPRLNGFEVLELVEQRLPVIFITAHDEHAVRAFEVHAIDYLLKPFTEERLASALARAMERIGSDDAPDPLEFAAGQAVATGRALGRVLVRDGSKVHVIPIEKIDYFEAQDDYVGIRSEGHTYLKKQKLGDLESSLDPGRFVRIHRGFILNVERLAAVELYARDSRVAILTDGTRLPVSRAGHARLKELL